MDIQVLRHAALGAAIAGGGVTAVQSLLARKISRPSSLAISVATLIGVFRLLGSIKKDKPDGKNAPGAAAVAAVLALLALDAKRRKTFVAYAFIEALITLAKKHTSLADVKHIELPVGAVVCCNIIYMWIYGPEFFDKSHLATLDSMCVVPKAALQRMRDEFPSGQLASRCDVFHRDRSCAQFHADYFVRSLALAAKIYVPIYLISAGAMKYKQWIWGPRPSIVRLAIDYLRTSVGLGMLYQIPLFGSCVSPIQSHRVTVALAGLMTTFAITVEHKKRRASVLKAISVYSLASAAARLSFTVGLSPRLVRLGQFSVFAASLAIMIQHRRLQSPQFMRLLYGFDPEKPAAKASGTTASDRDQPAPN